MCTVTWLHQDDGYQLLCNRDENRKRQTAAGPSVQSRDGVHFIAPHDGDFGGTWIATNEFGISLCLLNGPRPSRGAKVRSRGLLLLDLISAQSTADVRNRLSGLDLSIFAAFVLAVLEPRQPPLIFEWTGVERRILPPGERCLPLTSSSFDSEGVRSKRRQEYLRIGGAEASDANSLLAFHRSHGASPDAYSPCMHRADAETVSFSWIKVTGAEASFSYTDGAPCKGSPSVISKLALRR